MTLNDLQKLTERMSRSERMPVLFVGHGNPMNAIEDNEFSRGWQAMGKALPKPNAILCISAHWETDGTYITAMEEPRTIHDFGGFPQELYQVHYPAPGSPLLAEEVRRAVTRTRVQLDQTWGLDHGCWSVAMHLFPKADVPVLQMSLDFTKSPRDHYELAQELLALRTRGVLIVGSGNTVHNLRAVDWQNPDRGYDWALEANDTIKKLIADHEHPRLINYQMLGRALQLAVPTPEHFLPLLYALGLQQAGESVTFFNDKTVMGSLAMTSVKIS